MQKTLIQKLISFLFSYYMMIILFVLLGVGAAVATFIENDYGSSSARVLVYNHIWYEVIMVLACVNLLGIIKQRKMWKQKGKFIFHISFVVMLIGAALTRYAGYEGIMHIREGQTQSDMISLEAYMQVTIEHNGEKYYFEKQKEFGAIGDNSFSYTIPFKDKMLEVYMISYKFAKKGQASMNLIETALKLGDEQKIVKLVGQRGQSGLQRDVTFKDNTIVHISYGSKALTLPFSIMLRDFQLDRYPGSMSPSSYASEVTVFDKNKKFDFRIYMNSTLNYGGYKFFQSSYDKDERGTILSVNNDPGKNPTYLGYFLLIVGLLMNFFDKKSRFSKLIEYLKRFNTTPIVMFIAFVFIFNTQSYANEQASDSVKYLKKYKIESKSVAKNFSHLIVQSTGRMKPMDTFTHEILSKLTRKSSFLAMDGNQVVLGMMTRPDVWQTIKMLKISTPKLKQELGVEPSRKYIAFQEIFHNKQYRLAPYVKAANGMNPNKRGTFEKDVLKLDERFNIAYMVYYGKLLDIFPIDNANINQMNNNKWYNFIDALNNFKGRDQIEVSQLIRGLISSMANGNYDEADKIVSQIQEYQKRVGSALMPEQSKIDNEILFNELKIFPRLTLLYVILGLVLFIVSFLTVFNKKWKSEKINMIFVAIIVIAFMVQTFGMGMRWYISGHAPWSDTYESLVYIAWSTMFAGIIFFRKSQLALAATVIMAGIFMFTAHLSGIDPQITNLVPVLKSYWLTIHVSIITGSYGFLALGCMLGFMALLMFIFRSENKPHIDESIKQITAINEVALIIGLATLVVGNFIGGVWANESWGRYWGWDPKETWAYVSIVVYALVIHLRFVPKLNTPWVFATASTLAFASILMTYFGVNFYLSGMHSYATGDPVPIPLWVYVTSTIVFVVIAFSWRKRDLKKIL